MKSVPVALRMVAVSMFFMSQFMLFTYLCPFLETVTHVSVSIPSFMLLVLSLAGLAGTFLIEAFEKRPAPIAHRHPDLDDGVTLVLVSFGSLAATTTGFLGIGTSCNCIASGMVDMAG